MTDEFTRIARLRKRFGIGAGSSTLLGIGDDAAVLSASPDNLVLSVDASVEGIHFERHFGSLATLSARAFTAAISDLAAMGATARCALCALTLPTTTTDADFDATIEGLARAATRYGCPIVGGNLSAGPALSLTTTVVGSVNGTGLTRTGARAGDRICVTGTLGGAALGLILLQRTAADRGAGFVTRWLEPRARLQEGQQLLGLATAAIDISDGTLQDLGHVCEASGTGAEIEAAALPLDAEFATLARDMGQDPLALALSGGEDYELLYTIPEQGPMGPGTCIGRMTAHAGRLVVLDHERQPIPLAGHGYQHFTG